MQKPTSVDWREGNEAAHVAKHGIPFDFAARVFFDLNRIEIADTRKSYGELRFNTVGMVDGLCINVTFAMDDMTAWIISARPASRKERNSYAQNNLG